VPERIKAAIGDIIDFPKKGVVFKDITPVLGDPELLSHSIDLLAAPWIDSGINYVAGIEARGFIFAAAVAIKLNAGFIPIRKPGKLPGETYSESYDLEYGTDTVEVHKNAIKSNSKVLLIDDLLATGGTAAAAVKLLGKFNCTVSGVGFLINLTFLNGQEKLAHTKVHSIVSY
jgi:adenine phosphoribosyltransferase